MSEISIRSREGRISHSFAGCSATAFWLMAFKMRCAVFLYEKRPSLVTCLRHQKNKYRKKRGSWARIERNKAMKIKRITERPPIVEERSRIGDWEGDTIVGKEKKRRNGYSRTWRENQDSAWQTSLKLLPRRLCTTRPPNGSRLYRKTNGIRSPEITVLNSETMTAPSRRKPAWMSTELRHIIHGSVVPMKTGMDSCGNSFRKEPSLLRLLNTTFSVLFAC